jgi:site-specific recombinase XerD
MGGPSISAAVEMYLRSRMDRGEMNVQSAKKIGGAVRRMVESCGDRPVKKMDKGYAEAWLTSVSGKGLSTRRQYWSYLHSFSEWCVDEELLHRNPFRKAKPPKPPRRQPRPLRHDEVAAVLAVAPDPRARLIVLLMVQQGLRCIGVASLRAEDVDLQGRWMRVTEKGGHERVLPITDETLAAMRAYLYEYPVASGPLIRAWRPSGGSVGLAPPMASERPLTASTVSKWVTGWMYEAGVKGEARDGKSPHAFRHTCATDMLEQGANIVEVQNTLGHASLATTTVYTGVRPERLISAMGSRSYA